MGRQHKEPCLPVIVHILNPCPDLIGRRLSRRSCRAIRHERGVRLVERDRDGIAVAELVKRVAGSRQNGMADARPPSHFTIKEDRLDDFLLGSYPETRPHWQLSCRGPWA